MAGMNVAATGLGRGATLALASVAVSAGIGVAGAYALAGPPTESIPDGSPLKLVKKYGGWALLGTACFHWCAASSSNAKGIGWAGMAALGLAAIGALIHMGTNEQRAAQ